MDLRKTNKDLYSRAKKIIPGGTQLLSKRPEMFLPDNWPTYYSEAKGCEITDVDGMKYLDMGLMGVGSNILGYADDDVDNAVIEAIHKGSMTSLNPPEDIELAELLTQLHPWADMVRYARTGGEAMAVAIRLARAKTKKDTILFCGYHGWSDWYLAANISNEKALDGVHLAGLEPNGVPKALAGTAYPFYYNDTEGFIELLKKHKDTTAAIVIEAIRSDYPDQGFIDNLHAEARNNGIVLIVDEISSGWRLCLGGAHLKLNIEPDITVFAKGMNNGYPMAAILGKESVMQEAQKSFISSTYWTERIGPVAALASIKKMIQHNVPEYLISMGKKVQEGWTKVAKTNELHIHVGGIYPLSHFSFEEANTDPLLLKSLYTQFMLDHGFLALTAYYASFAHQNDQIDAYLDATDKAFQKIKEAIDSGKPESYLNGPVCHSGFQRLT